MLSPQRTEYEIQLKLFVYTVDIYDLYCVQQGMLQLILATDMARHKDILESLQNNIKKFEWENKSHMDSVI